ncbi:MAG: hypothetical protein JWR61_468 [Ferruginibacter sp.]|uniref:phage holin family protein n=1 Tax=Ferruginibacter sp. TaxID=1940288 RepID=UPI002657DA1B|nr:phage holin family protein [Ferruginibacter sp.]MDB5275513.1 hypothetical protein [Ferruginibacter sp.]
MENQPNSIGALFETAGDYVETRVDLLKLKTVDKSADIIASLTAGLIIAGVMIFGFVIVNLGLCIWLGSVLGQAWYGFFIVGGLYLLIGALIVAFKNKWIKEPVGDLIIKKLLN